MRKSLAACSVLLLLGACGGKSGPPDAGPTDAGEPIGVFGLATGNCYAYSATDAVSVPPSLGVAIEHDDVTSLWYLADGGSSPVKARTLVFRQTGEVRMTDYLYVDGSQLLLLKRDVAGAEQLEFRPALPIARVPFNAGDTFSQHGQARGFGGAYDGGLQPLDFSGAVDAQSLTIPANTTATPALTINYASGNTRLPTWSFVPGSGPIELAVQFAGDTNVPVYKLQSQRTIAPGDQTCGTSIH